MELDVEDGGLQLFYVEDRGLQLVEPGVQPTSSWK